ncbi:MAG: tryptophan synthase subunit alpha [Planctomycetota bacterium]
MSSRAEVARPVGRVAEVFGALREREETTVIPFVCGGHPSVAGTGELIAGLDDAGAQIIEVGVPFSDPIADGPVIAAAMHDVLTAGVRFGDIFDEVAKVRDRVDAALVAMVSVSIVHGCGGPAAFCDRAKAAGFDGFIFPDAPLEETGPLSDAAAERGLSVSLLVSPTTPEDRAAAVAAACSGFVYLLARSGITGARSDAPEIGPRVTELRKATRAPIACGFGISTAEHVGAVVEHADAAIVGSALVKAIQAAVDAGRNPVSAAVDLYTELTTGTVRL